MEYPAEVHYVPLYVVRLVLDFVTQDRNSGGARGRAFEEMQAFKSRARNLQQRIARDAEIWAKFEDCVARFRDIFVVKYVTMGKENVRGNLAKLTATLQNAEVFRVASPSVFVFCFYGLIAQPVVRRRPAYSVVRGGRVEFVGDARLRSSLRVTSAAILNRRVANVTRRVCE